LCATHYDFDFDSFSDQTEEFIRKVEQFAVWMTINGIIVLALVYVFVTILNIVAENVVSNFIEKKTRLLLLICLTLYANKRVNIWHLK